MLADELITRGHAVRVSEDKDGHVCLGGALQYMFFGRILYNLRGVDEEEAATYRRAVETLTRVISEYSAKDKFGFHYRSIVFFNDDCMRVSTEDVLRVAKRFDEVWEG